mgnify:FL=1|jgi:hypothetical protein
MKIKTNPAWTSEEVKEFQATIKSNGGYCPCRLIKSPENKCMCKEFMNQPSGLCHCGLYFKVEK